MKRVIIVTKLVTARESFDSTKRILPVLFKLLVEVYTTVRLDNIAFYNVSHL